MKGLIGTVKFISLLIVVALLVAMWDTILWLGPIVGVILAIGLSVLFIGYPIVFLLKIWDDRQADKIDREQAQAKVQNEIDLENLRQPLSDKCRSTADF